MDNNNPTSSSSPPIGKRQTDVNRGPDSTRNHKSLGSHHKPFAHDAPSHANIGGYSSFYSQSAAQVYLANGHHLLQHFLETRKLTEALAQHIPAEDQLLQSMPDASPTKWHLAHTTWFFDTFLLKPRHLQVGTAEYDYLFNSYYNSLGPQFPRACRGLISRPTLAQIWSYRQAVEASILTIWETLSTQELMLVELGIHHEQQHQELMITDVKHALSMNPCYPSLVALAPSAQASSPDPLTWVSFEEGLYDFGSHPQDASPVALDKPVAHTSLSTSSSSVPAASNVIPEDTSNPQTGSTPSKSDTPSNRLHTFCFDNETPRHKVWLKGFRLANRPITNAEFCLFMEDNGYTEPRFWLSEGWQWVRSHGVAAPLYWVQRDGQWFYYTLAGLLPINPHEPVCHLTYFEANAFATWAGKRLPTEFEWELAAKSVPLIGHFLNSNVLHPLPCQPQNPQLQQMYGDVWEWTESAYLPYPGYKIPTGAVGEYNGKFMVNQWVLRGGSCATPAGHIRATYRNFFPASARWQFSGVRLADDPI